MKRLLGLLLASLAFAQERQPNIVVIVADDLGYGELSIQGNPEIPTPHIDSIATGGVHLPTATSLRPTAAPHARGC